MKNFRRHIIFTLPLLLLTSCGGVDAWKSENIVNADLVRANMSQAAVVKPADVITAKEIRKLKVDDIIDTEQFVNTGMIVVKKTTGEGVDAKTLYGVYDVIHDSYVVTPSVKRPEDIQIVRVGNGSRITLGGNSTTIFNFYVRISFEVEKDQQLIPYYRFVDRYGHVLGDYRQDLWSRFGNIVYYEFVSNSGRVDEKIDKYFLILHRTDENATDEYKYFKYSADMNQIEEVKGFDEFAPNNWHRDDLIGTTNLAQYGYEGLRFYQNVDGANKYVLEFVDDNNNNVYNFIYDNARTAFLSFVGGAMNYQTLEQLPKDAKEYKFSYKGEKYDYHTYSVNFKNWSTREIDYPYLSFNASMAPVGPKYIYANEEDAKAKKYSYSALQAWEVDLDKKVLKANHTILVDGELKVHGDITHMDFANKTVTPFGNNFLIGSRVYDGTTLNQIGGLAGSRLTSTTDKIYYSFTDSGQIGIMDGNGKVLIKPSYMGIVDNRVQDGKIIAQKHNRELVLVDVDSGQELQTFDRNYITSNTYAYTYYVDVKMVEGVESYTRHLDINIFGKETKLKWDNNNWEHSGRFNYGNEYAGVDYNKQMQYIYFEDYVKVNQEDVNYRYYVIIGGNTNVNITPYNFVG
ncbi:MAG: hypothetical protein IJ194_03440 [Bacilli bacterium]|nr:hypothetical protein [Bacilli bacterium]